MHKLVNDFINELSKKLIIPVPVVYYDTCHFTNRALLAQCSSDGKKIYITPFSKLTMDIMFAIAHELRHIWQIQYRQKEYLETHKTMDMTGLEQDNMQLLEIDAYAFAAIAMMDFFHVKPSFDNFSPDVIEKIWERAEQINIEIY